MRVLVAEGPAVAFGPGNFFRRLVEEALRTQVVITGDPDEAELVVGSHAPSLPQGIAAGVDRRLSRRQGRAVSWATTIYNKLRTRRPSGVPSLWFTTENVRPPMEGWDITLSFDLDSLGGTNVYCPLWWGEVSALSDVGTISVSRLGRAMTVDQLSRHRTIGTERKRGFVCAFLNNPEPMRMHAIRMLRMLGPVEVFGRVSGRPVPRKLDVAQDFRYMLCFENDVYPGYVTEKPVEAWAASTVPIWRGSDPAGYLNEGALVNAASEDGLDGMIARIAELEKDPEAYAEIASSPLLSRPPDLAPVLQAIRSLAHMHA